MEDLIHEHAVVKVILEHRHIRKLVEGFIITLSLHLTRIAPQPVVAGSLGGAAPGGAEEVAPGGKVRPATKSSVVSCVASPLIWSRTWAHALQQRRTSEA